MDTTERLNNLQRWVDREIGRREEIRGSQERDRVKVEEHEAKAALTEKAILVLQAATETRRQELKDRVESLVTRGLRAVFERSDFEFAFKVALKRDQFGIVPVLRSKFGDRDLETPIVDGHGGGVADVISFILRVIVLSMARPRLAQILILDETFRHVSPEYLRGVATLLRELSDSAGIQFVLITHKPELLDAADTVYSSKLSEDGSTTFTLDHASRDENYHAMPRTGAVRIERGTAFDHEDLFRPVKDAETTISETADADARRARFPATKRRTPFKRLKKKK